MLLLGSLVVESLDLSYGYSVTPPVPGPLWADHIFNRAGVPALQAAYDSYRLTRIPIDYGPLGKGPHDPEFQIGAPRGTKVTYYTHYTTCHGIHCSGPTATYTF